MHSVDNLKNRLLESPGKHLFKHSSLLNGNLRILPAKCVLRHADPPMEALAHAWRCVSGDRTKVGSGEWGATTAHVTKLPYRTPHWNELTLNP